MPYELKTEDIESFITVNGIQARERGREIDALYCPYCHGGNNHDKYTFSINKDTGMFKCFRTSCGHQGHFVELARDFNFPLDFGQEKVKQYRRLPQREIKVRNAAVEYLAGRGITPEIAERYKITTCTK